MSGLGVFISYRREDSAGHAGRLYDRLCERFGRDRLFIDVDTIAPGADFVTRIDEALAECGALIAMIGTGWEGASNARGERRLDDPHDFVRIELAEAFARGIPVIPVLVRGADMPAPESLPAPLRPLSRRQALELDDARWGYDVGRLVEALEQTVRGSGATLELPKGSDAVRRRRILVVGIAAIAIAAAGSIAILGMVESSERADSTDAVGTAPSVSAPASGGPSVSRSPSSPSRGTILVRDGFSTQEAGRWFTGNRGSDRYTYAGGHYRINVRDINSWGFSPFGGETELSDLAAVGVEVDVIRMSGEGAVWAGLLCGYQDVENTYMGFVTLKGKYGLIERGAAVDDHLTQGSAAPIRVQGVNHLRLDCVEDPLGGVRIALWVNGFFMAEARGSEASLTVGRVGIVAGSSRHPAEVEFDDFVVRDLSE